MTIKEYLKSIDYDFIKEMDEKLTYVGLSKTSKPRIIEELSSKKDSSLVAAYYISLCLMDLDIDHPNIKAMHALEGCEGNLFVDYLILKDKVISAGKELIDRVSYYTKLSPVVGALKQLSNKLDEAKFLYADSLSVDMRALKDEKKAYTLFKELYNKGHVGSAIQLALLIYTEKTLKKYRDEILGYLEFAYNHGTYYAAYLLYKIYNEGFKPIKVDKEKASYWKAIFDEYKEENELSNYEIAIRQLSHEEEEVPQEEPFDIYKEYEIAINADDNYESLFKLLEKIKDTEPLFYYSEYIRTYLKKGQIDKATLYVPGFEKYLTKKVLENHRDEIIKMYTDLKLFDRVKILCENENNLTVDEIRELARDAEKENNPDKMLKYYKLLITMKDYSYYYKIYRLMVDLSKYDDAIVFLKQGAALDNLACEKELANLYLYGQIVKKDIAEAVNYLMSAYKKGDIQSAFILGHLLYEGRYVEENREKGLELMNKALDNGYPDKNGEYAITLFATGKEREAISYLKEKANKYMSENASLVLGEHYFNNKQYAKAKEYFIVASKYNNPSSMYHLGLIYKNGLGQNPNVKKAYNYFTTASMLEYPNSEFELGVCAYSLKKYDEAYRLLRDSQSPDNPYGYYLLSEIHYKRLIPSHSNEDAMHYAKLARKYGYKPSIKLNRN